MDMNLYDELLSVGAIPQQLVIHENEMVGSKELYDACEEGDSDTVTGLLSNGVDVNAPWLTGNSFWDDNITYLMAAAMGGHENVVRTLVEWEADLEVKDHNGHTAFMLALFDGQIEVGKVLLSLGCNWEATNNTHQTGLDFLSEENRQIMEDFIIDLEVEIELNSEWQDSDSDPDSDCE